MWIINFLICIALYSTILYTWSCRRFDKCMALILFGYFCCPVFRFGSLEVNGSYFITLILIIFCSNFIQRGKVRIIISRDGYILYQFGSIALMLTAGILNGVFNAEIIISLIGILNIAIGTYGCIFFFQRINNPFLVLRRAIVRANILHMLFAVIQLTNTSAGYWITKQLYVTSSRSIPIDTIMYEVGSFSRIYGATYSPTVLGGYVLFAFSFVLALMLIERGENNSLLLLSTVLLGFMAYSKTAIIGMPVIGLIFLMRPLFSGKMHNSKPFLQCIGLLLVGFGVLLLLAIYFGRLGQVRYYFGLFSNPLQIFQNRYGSSVDMGDPNATSGTAGTLALFLKHPIIGVGMLAVLDEVLWDSQYLSLLHDGGIVLFVVTLSFYISVYVRQRKAKGLPQMMILVALMLTAFAVNVFTVTMYIPFIALCVGVRGKLKGENSFHLCLL